MGQYYRILMERDGKKSVNLLAVEFGKDVPEFNRRVGHKLLEHSWLGTLLMDAVAWKLYERPMRLAWVGDYAKQNGEDDVAKVTGGKVVFEQVWGLQEEGEVSKTANPIPVARAFKTPKRFDYAGRCFVDFDKKEFISFDSYIAKSTVNYCGWSGCISPVSLMTAVGNDRGGGDYHHNMPHFAKVGRWAWDRVGITVGAPTGFKRLDIRFRER